MAAREGTGAGPGTATVVGAGIGGLATAIGLRRAGWAVTVLERRTELERYGAAFGIHPTAQSALDRLGVGEALRDHAVPYRNARIRTPDGHTLARLPLERSRRKQAAPNSSSPAPTCSTPCSRAWTPSGTYRSSSGRPSPR
ncbi:hypothetical protein SMICM304S_06113 [Streptomyces microflavus]